MPLSQESISKFPLINTPRHDAQRHFLGEFSRIGLLRKLGARRIDVDTAARTRRARESRDEQTHTIARRLRAGGIEAERHDFTDVVALGAISDQTATVSDRWRNINFLPAMQVTHGARHRAELGSYLSQHPKGSYCQYFVLTGGERCTIAEIPRRFSEMTRSLSRFVNRARTEWPFAEFVARQNEVTINEDRLAHPHINVAVIFLNRVQESTLIEFTNALRSALGGWVKNNRRIKSIDEFVKYSVKFGIELDDEGIERGCSSRRESVLNALQPDLFDHADNRGDYLVSLYHSTFKSRAFAAFSRFADWRRDLRARRLVPRRIGDDFALVRMCPYRPRKKMSDEQTGHIGRTGRAENILLNWAMPHAHGDTGTLIEPTIRILNFTPTPDSADGRDRLMVIRDLQNHLRTACNEAEAARQPRIDDKVVDLAEARAKRAERYEGARSAALYRSHKHDNCPPNTFTPIGLRDEYLHHESGAVFTKSEAEAYGYQPPPSLYGPEPISFQEFLGYFGPASSFKSPEPQQLSFLIA
jgi:hypothetical protein